MQAQTNDPIFTADDLIHSYSRQQAIEDGVLIDATPMVRQAGFIFPVALTAAAWAECVSWRDEDGQHAYQDEGGRLWDVLIVARTWIRQAKGPICLFPVHRVPRGGCRAQPVRLKAVCGSGDDMEPVITIMLEGED